MPFLWVDMKAVNTLDKRDCRWFILGFFLGGTVIFINDYVNTPQLNYVLIENSINEKTVETTTDKGNDVYNLKHYNNNKPSYANMTISNMIITSNGSNTSSIINYDPGGDVDLNINTGYNFVIDIDTNNTDPNDPFSQINLKQWYHISSSDTFYYPNCIHFLNVEINEHYCNYTLQYSIHSDIIQNYFLKSNVYIGNDKHKLSESELITIVNNCKKNYPINSDNEYVYNNKNNSEYISKRYKYWNKRLANKNIILLGDSVSRRLGEHALTYLRNTTSDTMIPAFDSSHGHGHYEKYNRGNNFHCFTIWERCIDHVWRWSGTNISKWQGIRTKFNLLNRNIDYVVVIVGAHNIVNYCYQDSMYKYLKKNSSVFRFNQSFVNEKRLRNALRNWDLNIWFAVFKQLYNDFNRFVTQRFKGAKLIVATQVFIDPNDFPVNGKGEKINAVHSFLWQSLIKRACLLYNIPIIDLFEWTTQRQEYFVLNDNNQTEIHYKNIRNKCLKPDWKGIHFDTHTFGRNIIWQLMDHVFKLCESDPSTFCNPRFEQQNE